MPRGRRNGSGLTTPTALQSKAFDLLGVNYRT